MGFLDKVKRGSSDSSAPQSNAPADAALTELKTAQDTAIEDVLTVLGISPTFEIPGEIFLPEDLSEVSFATQVPHGYDEGQVMQFVGQTRVSIKFLVALLHKRNSDVAKLASVIDKMQVEANNMKLEQELANGINIMPTMDDADLENQLMETKLSLRRAEDKVHDLQIALEDGGFGSGLPSLDQNSVDQSTYEAVLDELSLSRKRTQMLEEQNLQLKSRIAIFEDEADDELGVDSLQEDTLSASEYALLGVEMQGQEAAPVELPSDSVVEVAHEEFALPGADDLFLPVDDEIANYAASAPHDDSPPFALTVEGASRQREVEPEEEDALDELMRQLKEE